MALSKPLAATAIVAALSFTSAATHAAPGADNKPHGKRFPIDLSIAEQRTAERFALIDADDNEQISASEFASYERPASGREGQRPDRKRKLGARDGDAALTDAERAERKAAFEAELFALMDTDGDGQLSAVEASRDNRRASMRKLKRAKHFAKLDSNGDGQLSRIEFGARLARLQAADSNGDGQLSRAEMRALRRDRTDA